MMPELIFPLLIPLLTGILLFMSRKYLRVQTSLSLAGSLIFLASSLILLFTVLEKDIITLQLGNWPAPFGITLVCDLLSAIMLVLSAIITLVIVIYSLLTVDDSRKKYGYFSLIFMLMFGISGSFLTGDLFNLYVWFEVMLMASFVLMVLGGERAQLEGAVKYVSLNLIGSFIFLSGVGILYGKMGTLNMADLAAKLSLEPGSALVSSSAMLFLVAFSIKAAAFPFYFWLPASYHTPPAAVSALFAGLLTKVGVYALIRIFTLIFIQDIASTHQIILVIAGLTMIFGVLGAASQFEVRRILSFHIISQIGYMLMGLGLFTSLALAGSIFYIMHHIIVKTNLFLTAGVIQLFHGSSDLKKTGGLFRKSPLLAFTFLIPALSLAGIPPLSGFWAKFTLIKAGLDLNSMWIVVTALLVSLVTLYSMTKIWSEAFWKPHSGNSGITSEVSTPRWKLNIAGFGPMIFLLTITLIIGLFSEPFFQLAFRTAEQLLHPEYYIDAVLRK
ncbi:MAG: Na+/H+ antiporter subunit D [Calditrichaeota bacterium]|nr:Na+/H+ antiporter subunit D [Calditrichota bacterium]RQW07086.1 MAG: Na+/H+ antiporter subunit D [Calditrichota bacterium]